MAKRKMPPHIVLPDGRWRFVKRGSKRAKTKTRRHGNVAKRRSHRSGGGRGFGMGGWMKHLIRIGAGVGDSYLDPMLPIDGIAAAGLGILTKDATLAAIGEYKVGYSLGNVLPLPGRGTVSASGGGGIL